MADYGNQQRPEYARGPSHGQPTGARETAFTNIFGASPQMAGRSQTMTSQSHMRMPDRAATMSSQTADMMQRAPPLRQPVNGYDRRPHPQYDQRQGPSPGEQRPMDPQNQYNRPMPNGYGQDPRYHQGPPQPQRQPQPQYLPQPLRPERQPYGQPQRFDPRTSPPGQPPFTKPIPNRFPGPPGPAMNSDPYRSQSLALNPRPQFTPGGPSHPSQANTFRQQPYMNHMARTTAQGRVVPERPDERTMSMTSYTQVPEHTQTMSGRIIPNRRRESGGSEMAPGPPGHPQSHMNAGLPPNPRSISQGNMPNQSRTMSMASTIVPPSERTSTMSSMTSRPDSTQTLGSNASNNRTSNQSMTSLSTANQVPAAQRRAPLVYPALLSRVAETFQDRVGLTEKEKDGLVYKSAFTGADAVDLISFIIKTTDRNLALLLGRSLDAQKFFHDVTYAHRLRDSTNEIYQFRETMVEDKSEINGVFTLLTECYSPTCTRDRLCYSIACPRRLEQQARLNMRIQPGLKREESRASLHEDKDNEEQKLWINTVPKEISDSVSEKEQKRQEVISELMYTERDFVKDLEYLRDFWMKPLRNPATSPIPEHRREKFVRTVFSNCQEVYMVNSRMAEQLTRRQQKEAVVRNVGDIFLEYVPHFAPFIKYGANQLFGKYEFEHEKRTNTGFAKFVDEVERMKESRKLELNGYLTKPTTRLARYPLLLENIAKYTADDNPDKEDIPKVIKIIKETLSKVNVESGKAENHFNLMQLNKDLKFRPGEFVDLKLTDENRQLVFKGTLKKTPTETTGDITCYLFDHAVLLVRAKTVNKREEQKVYKKPIPLELLVITQMEEVNPKLGIAKRPSANLIAGKAIAAATPKNNDPKQQGYPITFKHLGKGGYELTLFASTPISQQKWMEHIDTQQRSLRERSNIFTKTIVNEGFFSPTIRVTCAVPLGMYSTVALKSLTLTLNRRRSQAGSWYGCWCLRCGTKAKGRFDAAQACTGLQGRNSNRGSRTTRNRACLGRQDAVLLLNRGPGVGRITGYGQTTTQDLPRQLLQGRHLLRATVGCCSQDVRPLDDHQGVRAEGADGQQEQKVRIREDDALHQRSRPAQAVQRVLHPHRIDVDTFPAVQTLRWLRARFRSRQSGDARNAIASRPSRYFARLCRTERKHQTNSHRAYGKRVPLMLHGLLILRQPQRLASETRLEDYMGGHSTSFRYLQSLYSCF